jgi:DNA polymerase-3 subunit alpha
LSDPEFVHLHVHSDLSLLDGACSIPRLIESVRRLNMPAVALTDHGNMFGAVEFYLEASKHGIKPILGIEGYVAPGSRFEKRKTDGEETNFHLTLLVRNERGYQNLCRLSTLAYREGYYYRPRMDRELLARHHEGLIALSGCPQSEFGIRAKNRDWDGAIRVACELSDIFGKDSFFLEVQNHGLEVEKEMIEAARRANRALGLKLVATNDSHYICKEDWEAHDVLLALNTGSVVADSDRLRLDTPEFYIKSPAEMHALFGSEMPEALKTTLEIADRCNLDLRTDEIHLPVYTDESGVPPAELIRIKCLEALPRKYGENCAQARSRLDYELSVIEKMGFQSYFLIVQDFVNYARSAGIPVGPGRGSAAGSIVSYLLGITDLDPLRYGLLFERFLNPERREMPDIDMDFAPHGRAEVINYIRRRFGQDRVSQIVSFNVMKARAVIRDVARALGMELRIADELAKKIPRSQILDISLADALAQDPELKKRVEGDPAIQKLWTIASKLENLRRHCSKHAGGVVICDRPITEYAPIYSRDGEECTQYDMDSVARMGLLKMDILGVETLSVIQETLKLIRKNLNAEVDIDRAPLDDGKTYELLHRGFVKGVFQLEISRAARVMIMQMKPTSVDDLMAAVALNRPGPMQSGMVEMYNRRKHGLEQVQYPHPDLESILKETYGAILYQEQVMTIANRLAGYSMAEADKLRKAMGKKLPAEMAKQKDKFLAGCRDHGVADAVALSIWEDISKFAGYGFNKSHSAAYGMIAYRTAYLKANYPVEFMCVLMTANIHDENKLTEYIEECRRIGIRVLPPDINRSQYEFAREGDAIRMGLGAVKNVGEKPIQAILEARRGLGRPLASIFELCESVDLALLDKRVLEFLITGGAFDSLSVPRAHLLTYLEEILRIAARKAEEKKSGQLNIFMSADDPASGYPDFAPIPEWPPEVLLAREKKALGLYITQNPVARYAALIELLPVVEIDELETYDGDRENVRLAGIVTNVRLKMVQSGPRRGARYVVFDLSDLTGRIECVMFASDLERNEKQLREDAIAMLTGSLDDRNDQPSIIARDLTPMDEITRLFQGIVIELDMRTLPADAIDRLKAELAARRGPTGVNLRIHTEKNGTVLGRLPGSYNVRVDRELLETLERVVGPGKVKADLDRAAVSETTRFRRRPRSGG